MTNTTTQKKIKNNKLLQNPKNIRLTQKQTKKYNAHIFDKTNYPPEKKIYTNLSRSKKR
jgi:hypothetical protein